jgi:glycosyltransferase involved in cell wall biosynthesis
MSLPEVNFVIHPYSWKRESGAGHDRYAYDIISGLAERQISHKIFESHQDQTMAAAARAEVAMLIRLLRTPTAGKVFHATATVNAQCAITAGRHPLITTIHDVLWFFVGANYDSGLKRFLKTQAIRRAARRSDLIIVPFRSTFEFLIDKLKVPERRLRIVPYGYDEAAFFPKAPNEALPRPQFFPKDGRVILFVGQLTFGKGVDDLINAFTAVAAAIPDVQLVIGSGGWHKSYIEEIWRKSPVRNRIVMAGYIPEADLRPAYVHADVTCFPSRYGFGLPTLESMACGTVTVSGETLDAPEFVGDAGLMVKPNSPEALSTTLIRTLSDEQLCEELRQRGLAKARQFTKSSLVENTIAVYREFSTK